MPQRLPSAFNKEQPLYCLQEAGLKGKEYKSQSKRRLQPLGRLQQAGQEGGQTSSSQHICLHLCLSEEKLNYLTLENKGEKKRACQYQLAQRGAQKSKGQLLLSSHEGDPQRPLLCSPAQWLQQLQHLHLKASET